MLPPNLHRDVASCILEIARWAISLCFESPEELALLLAFTVCIDVKGSSLINIDVRDIHITYGHKVNECISNMLSYFEVSSQPIKKCESLKFFWQLLGSRGADLSWTWVTNLMLLTSTWQHLIGLATWLNPQWLMPSLGLEKYLITSLSLMIPKFLFK